MYRIIISGGFFLLTRESDQKEHIRHPRYDTSYIVFHEDDSNVLIRFKSVTGQLEPKLSDQTEFRFDQLINDVTGVAFTTVEELKTLLDENLGFRNGGGVGSGSGTIPVQQVVDNYSALSNGEEAGEIAFVKNSQGTKWLPGSWGGTYYGSGFYIWDGTQWQHDKDTVYKEFHDIINDIIDLQNTKMNKPVTKQIVKDINDLLSTHTVNGSNEIQLWHKTYCFDSTDFDMTGYTLLTHPLGTAITGISQGINNIKSTEQGISLIKSRLETVPVSPGATETVRGVGSLFIENINFTVDGNGSQVINMQGDLTDKPALDMFYVGFLFCTSLGTLTDLRQGFLSAGFLLNNGNGFLLRGAWSGGFTLTDTRSINTANILRGDLLLIGENFISNFSCNNIRSNVNATVPANAVAFDFREDMFNNDNGFQLQGGYYDGAGEMVPLLMPGSSIFTENSRKSFFKNNEGPKGKNTYRGSEWECTLEVPTLLTVGILTKIEGVTTYTNEVHFTNSGNNAIVYNSTVTTRYRVDGNIYIVGGANDVLDLYVRKWNNSTSQYENIKRIRRKVVSVFGEDTAEFNFFVSTELSENDRIELWIVNLSDNSDITMVNTSGIIISKA